MYQEQGRLTGNQFTVSTIVTTGLLGEISKGFNVPYYDVLTGFKNIAAVILANEGKKNLSREAKRVTASWWVISLETRMVFLPVQ